MPLTGNIWKSQFIVGSPLLILWISWRWTQEDSTPYSFRQINWFLVDQHSIEVYSTRPLRWKTRFSWGSFACSPRQWTLSHAQPPKLQKVNSRWKGKYRLHVAMLSLGTGHEKIHPSIQWHRTGAGNISHEMLDKPASQEYTPHNSGLSTWHCCCQPQTIIHPTTLFQFSL